jgi:hypothetical protein
MNLPRATSEPAERSKLEIFERSLASWASPQKRRVRDPAPQRLQVKPAAGHMVSMALAFRLSMLLRPSTPTRLIGSSSRPRHRTRLYYELVEAIQTRICSA